MKRNNRFALFCAGAVALGMTLVAVAADNKKPAQPAPKRETVAKPPSAKELKRRQDLLRKELETPFKKWMNEDVAYIITDPERAAFKGLKTDDERESFIEGFWLRRDPSPDSVENEFKEEHYRRIAYANDRFAAGIPGWKTDRGRIYIAFGPPDQRTENTGGTYQRPREEGGGTTSAYPFEQWRYRYLDDIGTDIEIEFVDKCMCGAFMLTMDPSEKDALINVPNAGLTDDEAQGLRDKADRFSRTDGTRLGVDAEKMGQKYNQFSRLELFTKLQKAPSIKFKDLEAVISSSIRYNVLPIQVRTDFVRMTNSTVQTFVTALFQKRDLQYKEVAGVSKATLNIVGRVTSISRRVVSTFDHKVEVEVPSDLLQESMNGSSIYQAKIPLAPGNYRLNLVAKDEVSGNMVTYEHAITVPRYDDETLGMSSVILADIIEDVPTRNIGGGQFIIGASKVRPNMAESFRRDQKMGIYFQMYNFSPDPKTQKPTGTVQYQVVKKGETVPAADFTESLKDIQGASAQQITVRKFLNLQSFDPGEYTLKMKVVDETGKQQLTPSATFKIL
jgi:GWxTD domain-containing protein